MQRVTFQNGGALTAADVGKACNIDGATGDLIIGSTDTLLGRIEQVADDDVAVAVQGFLEFDYTGAQPTRGTIQEFTVESGGEVQVGVGSRQAYVIDVDAPNTKVTLMLL